MIKSKNTLSLRGHCLLVSEAFSAYIKTDNGKNSDKEIEVLILSRKDIPVWKEKNDTSEINLYYNRSGLKINDVFKPTISDAYAFVLNNWGYSVSHEVKTGEVTLVHNWQQEVKESQLKDYYKEE